MLGVNKDLCQVSVRGRRYPVRVNGSQLTRIPIVLVRWQANVNEF